MKLDLKPLLVLRNPWNWDEKTLEWARKEAELSGVNCFPANYDECWGGGCCYPGRCGKAELRRAV